MRKTHIQLIHPLRSLGTDLPDDVLTDATIEAVASLVQELPGGWNIFRQQTHHDDAMLLISPATWGLSDDAVTVQRSAAGLAVGLSQGDILHDIGLASSPWSALLLVSQAVRYRAERLRNAA
jgi:hypothetical protein